GFRFSATTAGIKRADLERLDFGLVVADVPAAAAAVTTTNIVVAAPVMLTRERLQDGLCRAILVNSGNANAFTGDQGMRDAIALTAEVSAALKEDPSLVIPLSTGVIGVPLPLERMKARIPSLIEGLETGSAKDVAQAMLTTDTRPKMVSLKAETSFGGVRLLGMAKGSGMIAPRMATMLAVLLIDARVHPVFLREALHVAVEKSFNSITVDGDMSTNDTVVALAGGSPHARTLESKDRAAFSDLLTDACMDLARQIIRDGEGATKAVEIRVQGAPDTAAALRIARKIAESSLVKTAIHGEDPNWGRIVSSAGAAGIAFDPNVLDLFIEDVQIVRSGALASNDWEPSAREVMKRREYVITLDLKAGQAQGAILTTDLSEEYVKINADYRS
ncbi:MAG: bifunctional glutamate N-acetyltransferase/amino-acid acetyltransferase ArgJ, partial [Desulfomonilaceae bacterium]